MSIRVMMYNNEYLEVVYVIPMSLLHQHQVNTRQMLSRFDATENIICDETDLLECKQYHKHCKLLDSVSYAALVTTHAGH